MEKGQIIETGSYEDLVAGNGEFSGLFKLHHNIPDEQLADNLVIN